MYEYTYPIIIIILLIGLIIVLLAQKKYPKTNNFLIFQAILFIVDFSFDLIFLLKNSRDVKALYVPSMIFFFVPIGVRLLLGIFIICREIFKNPKFHEWFTKHTINALMISLLSLIHIECLKLLDARITKFGNLNASFSKVTKRFIFWGVICSTFICDLPQLFIQVIYKSSDINYDTIPFLTLIMGIITISLNVMIVIYYLINSLSKNLRPEDRKPRNIGNGPSYIQQRSDTNVHRSSIMMGPIEDEIEFHENDESKDAFSRRVKSWSNNNNIVKHSAELREKRTKSWDQLIRNSREFNYERDSAIIREIEKEKRVSVIENRNTFVEEKGIILTFGNTDDSENNTVKDDNTYTSITIERNTNNDI
ncbi:hypothetical protein F8M41_012897 [Gigaspora margarita]|uniref:Uncharacterized protein n=2 Tax=Gigaspora margarita TaxID=4874 RepID=A0A8H4EPF0_GIGMA|nr:hypothetical protein F8M41_012897 [Gigaspora margarita]